MVELTDRVKTDSFDQIMESHSPPFSFDKQNKKSIVNEVNGEDVENEKLLSIGSGSVSSEICQSVDDPIDDEVYSEGEKRKQDDCVDGLFKGGEIVLAEGIVFPLEGCITEIRAEGIGCGRIVRGKGFLIGYFFIWIKVLQV